MTAFYTIAEFVFFLDDSLAVSGQENLALIP
jgi:hypothetical protein